MMYKNMSLKQLIDDVTKQIGYELKNGEIAYFCPKCHHRKRKLQVNINNHKWKCWVCGQNQGTEGTSLKSLFRLFGANTQYYEKLKDFGYSLKKDIHLDYKEFQTPISLPSEFKPLWKKYTDIQHKHAIHYLKTRNVGPLDIMKYNIGYCTDGVYKNKIIFPSYDEFGILNYFTSRTWIKDSAFPFKKPPYSSSDVIGFEFFINWNLPIYICEGVFDAFAIKRNVIPLYGKTIGKRLKQKIIEKKPVVYLILDNDAIRDVLEICEELMRYDIKIFPVFLDEKDPSEMGYLKVHELINHSKQISFSDIIRMKLNT